MRPGLRGWKKGRGENELTKRGYLEESPASALFLETVRIPRTKRGNQQTIEMPINEEALLLGRYLGGRTKLLETEDADKTTFRPFYLVKRLLSCRILAINLEKVNVDAKYELRVQL